MALRALISYLRFRLQSGNAHGLHSPFVFQLYTEVISAKNKQYYAFENLENIRLVLSSDDTLIQVNDLGAGSRVNKKNQRKIKDIARYSTSGPEIMQLLFRLVDFFRPQVIVELGTGLGLSTLYMSEAASARARIFTFEACPQIAAVAERWFKNIHHQVQLVSGDIDQTLAPALQGLEKVDFVFFDANHRYAPTLKYFELCLEKAHEESVFVFDDIHWSAEMEKAWNQICQHPGVSMTVDLFHLGLVFFRKKQPKQHFALRL